MTEPNEIGGVIPPLSVNVVPPLDARDHIQGSTKATIVLMKYGDYQCVQSGQAHVTIKAIQQRLGEQLCFIFRHFPQVHLHAQAQRAAESAEAAQTQGKFWEMHDVLFEHQQSLEDADLVQCAAQIGLDVPRFLHEFTEHLHADRVQEDIESGRRNGVVKTPTFFIGIRHEDTQNLEELMLAVLQLNSAEQ